MLGCNNLGFEGLTQVFQALFAVNDPLLLEVETKAQNSGIIERRAAFMWSTKAFPVFSSGASKKDTSFILYTPFPGREPCFDYTSAGKGHTRRKQQHESRT